MCCSTARGTVGAGLVPGDVLGSGGAQLHDRGRAQGHAGERLGAFVASRRGTFPLDIVAAHVLRHGAGNGWGRVLARGRAGERFRRVRCMGAVSLRGCDFFLCKHGTGNVSLVNRSRPRAAARRGERLGPVSCPGTCWGAEGHSCMTGDVPRDMLGSG